MLEEFLVTNIFAFMLVMCRVGSAVMLIPGIGEAYVAPRFRLTLALGITLVITPVVAELVPRVPDSPLALAVLMTGEILIGLFFGFVTRILISTMHMAGMIISFQSGLSAATMFDFNQASQGSAIGNFLSIVVVLLIFALGLHHLMLKGVLDSYTLFIPGTFPPADDMANLVTRLLSDSFNIAMRISAPHIVVGMMVYLAAGVLARLMPTLQIFFLIMAPQILISFILLATLLSSMLVWYMVYFEESLQKFLAP